MDVCNGLLSIDHGKETKSNKTIVDLIQFIFYISLTRIDLMNVSYTSSLNVSYFEVCETLNKSIRSLREIISIVYRLAT